MEGSGENPGIIGLILEGGIISDKKPKSIFLNWELSRLAVEGVFRETGEI
jgi:hypothetical protein